MSDYHGLPTGSLVSPFLRLDYLQQGGLRIVRLVPADEERNLLAETPAFGWDTPYGRFSALGGHRLWHAPQTEQTATPEPQPLEISEEGLSVRLFQPADPWNHLTKCLDITLDGNRPALTIAHTLTNMGEGARELAPWAITQLPLGGQAILPLSHGGPSTAPNRHLAFWPYVRLPDPRLMMGEVDLCFNARPYDSEFKLGYFAAAGWVAYQWQDGRRLTKRFQPQPGLPHADHGCNVEIYCNNGFLELETLGPLTSLAPGQSVEHIETWELQL